jgi:transposase InsO family protein
MVSLPERRRAVTYLKNEYPVSERRACAVLSVNRSSYRHQGTRSQVDDVHREVVRLSERYSYWGYRKIYDLVDRDRFPVGRERVRLIRRREGLQVVKKRKKKKVLGRSTQWVHRAEYPNHVWCYDFVSDRVIDGRTLRCLTVVDEFTREGLTIYCATSVTSVDVIAVLAELIAQHGRPLCIRSDNGPEFIAAAVKKWLAQHSIGTRYIDPGSPWQNPFSESFNSIFRITCLDRWEFESVLESRAVIDQWLEEYNTIRPHGSLGGRSPAQFIEDWANAFSQESKMNQKSLT